jgi:nitrate/nitrite-specific signal transduction histidine kinase
MMATVHSMEVTTASSTARRDERRQLSVTLHNSLAQQIGYLHLSLDRLADAAERLPLTVVQELAGLRDVAGDAYHQIRDLLAGLRTPQFHNLGHLLDSRLQVFGRATGLKTHLEVRGEPRLLLPELNQQVFGLVHESLNNIQKHAGASRVEILLDWRETELVVEVADDGRGFDSAAAIADGHYGLAMLQEQTAELRGTLAIISVPGQGARLLFRIPLAAEVGAPSGLTPQSGGTS